MSGTTRRQIAAFPNSGKRIPRNPKYANTRRKVDTGSSMSVYEERMEYIRSNFKMKKGEIFKRIKATTLAQLIVEVAEAIRDDGVADDDLDEAATFPGYRGGAEGGAAAAPAAGADTASAATEATGMTSRSTLLSVIQGVGALDDETHMAATERAAAEAARPSLVEPYLVVDLRDPEDFEQCHIRGAHNFPASRLSRAQNHWSPEMYAYINKPDRMLIVYDLDEKIGPKAAETFVQRGVDNVFLLSGGLRVLCDKIPDGIVVGRLPGAARIKGKGSGAAGPMYAPLTKENIEQIRQQLDEIAAGPPSSVASSRAGSRATARGGARGRSGAASRSGGRDGTASVTSSKSWK
mmetsp:Transcript_16794/g.43641  ORF Transcript_16794/g.43641 Transcript_16794/m.43641 type:complete len:350 (+) Transcript_16794:61-1110(+)